MSEDAREPTEEEIRAAVEEQLRHLRVEDVVLQTIATLINVAVFRLGLTGEDGEKDAGQAKMAIDAARALLPVTPPEQAAAVQDALSQVQLAFAREAQGAPPAEGQDAPGRQPPAQAGEGTAQGDEGQAQAAPGEAPSRPGPEEEAERARARSRIWTPPGT